MTWVRGWPMCRSSAYVCSHVTEKDVPSPERTDGTAFGTVPLAMIIASFDEDPSSIDPT
jgi:hypothetical protein